VRLVRGDRCGKVEDYQSRAEYPEGWEEVNKHGKPPWERYADWMPEEADGLELEDYLDVCPDCLTPLERGDFVLLDVMLANLDTPRNEDGRLEW
jgi:hypothetical protein